MILQNTIFWLWSDAIFDQNWQILSIFNQNFGDVFDLKN